MEDDLRIAGPLVRELRLERRPGQRSCVLPVLLLTALDSAADKVRGLDAGADDHVVKPFSLDEFHAGVRALL